MASHWVNSSRHLPRERAGSSVILSIFLKIATLLLIAAFFAQPTAANPIKPLEAFTRNGGGLLDTSFSAGLLDLGGVNLGPLDTPQCKADAVRLGPEQVLGRRLLQTNDREKQKLNLLSEYLFTLGIALVGPASNVTGPNNAAVPLGEVLTIPGNPRFPQFDTLLGQNVSLSAVRLKKENFTGNGFKYDGNLGTGNFSFSIPGGGEFASSGNISGGGNFASSATCINLLATQDFTNTMENVTLVWYSLGVNQPFTTTRRIVSPIEALQVFQGDYPPTDGFPPPGTLGSGLEMFWPKLKQPIRFTFNKAPVGNITCARYDLSPNNDIGPDKTPVLTTWDVPNGGLQNVSCSEGEPVYTTENASALTDGYTPYGQTPFCQTWRLGAQLAFVFLTGNSGCEFDPALKYDRCLCPNYCSNKPCEPGCLRSVDPTGALANETISNRKSFKAPDSAQLCCNLTAPVCQEPWPVPTPNADKCCAGKNSTLFDGFCCCGPSKPDPPAWWIIFLVVVSFQSWKTSRSVFW